MTGRNAYAYICQQKLADSLNAMHLNLAKQEKLMTGRNAYAYIGQQKLADSLQELGHKNKRLMTKE